MKGKTACCKRRQILTAALVLMQILVLVLPGQAQVATWDEVSSSINHSFSGQGFSQTNWVGLILTIIVIIILIVVFRWYWSHEKKAQRNSYELYQKKRHARIARMSAGQQQNRHWFRLKTTAEFRWIPAAEAAAAKEDRYIKDRLLDISGGGLSFSTAEEINRDDELLFLLDTGEGKLLSLNGRVVRIVEEESKDETINYNVSVQFGDVRPGERDRLVSWIIKRQRDVIYEEQEKESLASSEEQEESGKEEEEALSSPSEEQEQESQLSSAEEPESSSFSNEEIESSVSSSQEK